jgi:glutathione S-transferase
MTPMQRIVADFIRVPSDRDALGVKEARRLLARPSVARSVDEARPFRQFFPPGAPNRD